MALRDKERYYWLKLDRGFFKRHDIAIIEDMPNGKDYVLFYLKLMLESVDHEGALTYDIDEISASTREKPDFILDAINVLRRYELVRVDSQGYNIPYITRRTVFTSFERSGRDRNSPDYKTWRRSVFERDDYTCQICGSRGKKLNAHHIVRWVDNSDLRFDVSNGVTLCERCHKMIHRKRQ